MTRSPLARAGLAALAAVLMVTGPTTPAQAAATGTVSGRLTTAAGQAVADARVTVYDNPDYNHIDETTTDENGRYTIRSVPVGGVKVSFEAGHEQWATGKLTFDEATAFTVTAGRTTTVNEKLLPTGTITGRFTHPAGAPLSYVQVIAEHAASGQWSYGSLDEDGRYTIDVLPGAYTVGFRLDNARQWAPQARDSDSATRYPVAAGETVTVDDTLLPSGSIGGKLVDAKGVPVAKADVGLLQNGESVGYASTEADGTYVMDTVLTGAYKLSFHPPKGSLQWAPGKLSEGAATSFAVAEGKRTTVNEKLLAVGTVVGRFTKRDGKALAGVEVRVSLENGDSEFEAKTDRKGKYRFANVTIGRYTVSFTDKTDRTQYAYGKGSLDTAARFSVKAGKTTTVNDKQVAPATMRITAKDARTGKKLKNFCTFVAGAPVDSACTKGTEVVVKNLAARTYHVSVSPADGSLYQSAEVTATVKAGQSKAVAVPLALGGAIRATATDRATGKAVGRACIVPIVPGTGGVGDGGGDCTDSKGKVQSRALAPGTYNVFVEGPQAYGAQWLGASGGTGDQRAAARIAVKAGKVATAPTIKLDKAGTVTGTVTTADGKPVQSGDVSYSAWGYGVGPSHGADIDKQGAYTLTGLGPYAWPLVFTTDAGRQWSGNAGNRFAAKTVTVQAGATVRHDETVVKGVQIGGRISGGTISWARLTAHDSVTGDPIGVTDVKGAGPYALTVPGGGTVKLHYSVDRGKTYVEGWYDRAKDIKKAKTIAVPMSGSTTVDVKVP